VVGYLVARVVIDGCELPLEHAFGVVDGLRYDVVVGVDVMEPYDVELDVKEGRARLRRVPPTLEVA
jgi:hypothetical protein